MHALPQIALVLATAAGSAFAWPSPQDILPTLPTSCLQLEGAFNGVNTDLVLQSIQEEVCAKGCPIVLTDYNTRLRNQLLVPTWTEVAAKMGAADHADALGRFIDDIVKMAETKCSAEIAWDQDICAQDENWPGFAACVQRNAWPLMLRNSINFLPLLSPDICPHAVSLLRSQEIWTDIVPQYLEKYALECPV